MFSLSAVFLFCVLFFLPSHHFVYGNPDEIGKIGKKKEIRVGKLSFPFGNGIGADTKQSTKRSLCHFILLAVAKNILPDTNSVCHFVFL